MASFKQYTASGGATEGFSIATFTSSEIHVYVDGDLKTKGVGTTAGSAHDYEIQSYTTNGGTIAWVSGKVPSSGTVRIVRITDIMNNADTDVEALATYSAGSSIKSDDLNDNQNQVLRALEEEQDQLIQGYDIEPGAVNSGHIKDGTIVDADIAAAAEIQVSKLKDGTARQVLQTAANGTDVEWTDSVSLDGTLDVDGNTTVGGTLGVTGESTLASATVSDLTSGRIVFTDTGGALVDSANLTFTNTGAGHLYVGNSTDGYGSITCSSITATTWNGYDDDAFWRMNRDSIDHYGKDTGQTWNGTYVEAIRIRKHDDNLSSSHTFSIAKDYTFQVGKYYNEGLKELGYATQYAPVLRVKQDIEQDRVTKTSTGYSVFRGTAGCEDEHGQIWIGDGKEAFGYNLTGTTINLGGFTSFDARRNGIWTANNNPTNPDGYQPVLMLSGQKGAMFVHPDNTSHLSNGGGTTTSGLRYLAYGAGGHGVESLGDSYNYGGGHSGWEGYRDPDECIDLLEAAADLQIIVGGARVKNKFEIGSGSVTGTLAISGTNVTATAAELNILDGVTATTAEINFVDGVTSNVQTQLDAKQPLDAELTELATMGTNTAAALADLTQAEVQTLDGVTATTTELNNLDGYTGTTSELNILDGVTATTAELNIVDGMTKATSLTSNSDTEFPTSKAVADHITTVIAPLGGLEVIATEVLFPNTQPDDGVVISISDAGGVAFNGSGVSTTATTVGGSTVTINGAPSSLYNETLVAGVGLMVSSTGSSQTYNYHKILGKEDDIKQLSDDINDFNARYRIASSAPSSDNDDGDLYYDTTLKKMKVYNAVTSQWDDVAQSSSSYIVTLSESFNGTLQDFTMSTAATDAQSTLVSINGVLQKPNAGTSTPSEGFAISGTTLKLAAAPPTGSDYFVVVLGDTVSIGTPSDNTVTSAKIVDGSIVNGDISSSAAIEGSKLDNPLHFDDDHKVSFGNLAGTPDFDIYHNGASARIENITGDLLIRNSASNEIKIQAVAGEQSIVANANGSVDLYWDGAGPKLSTHSGGVNVTGSVNPTGNVALLDDSLLKLGTSDDFVIHHDSTSGLNYIDSKNRNLVIRRTGSETDTMAQFAADGAVELYYDGGTSKLATTSVGVDVTHTGDARFYVKDTTNSETFGIRAYNGNTEVGTHTDHDWKIHRNNVHTATITTSGIDVLSQTVHLYNSADTSDTYFVAQNTSTGNAGIKMKNSQGEWIIIANDNLRFYDADNSQERLTITPEGDVGINDTDPEFRLSVKDYNNYVAEFESTNGNTLGSVLTLYGNSPSPADNDLAGILRFSGQNSASEKLGYSQIRCCITDVTDGTEDSELHLYNRKAGTNANRVKINDNIEILDGNLIVGNEHGIDFAAQTPSGAGGVTPATSAGDELFNHYERGIWEPNDQSGAGLTFSLQTASYFKIGGLVYINCYFFYPTTSDTSDAKVGGLPFNNKSGNYAFFTGRSSGNTVPLNVQTNSGVNNCSLFSADSVLTNAALSGKYVLFSGCYPNV